MAEHVGRYELVAPLRSGGMARIDLACLRGPYDFTRYLVIKRPLPHQGTDEAERAQFRVEARLLASIHHPNVVSVLEAGVDAAGGDFLALEYIHGVSVRELAPPRGDRLSRRPSLATSLTIIREACAGLHHAHELCADDGAALGVVHRDVSPSNLLVGFDGGVRVIDFGVAKLTQGATASGALRGKVSYMAPEQCKGHPIDRRVDVYALGVILFELATGHRPFHADDEVASLHKVVVGEVADPAVLEPALDPELAAIIRKAMAYDRDARFASALDLSAALEHLACRRGWSLGGHVIAAELAASGAAPEAWRSARQAPTSQTETDAMAGTMPAQGVRAAAHGPPRASRRARWAIVVGIAAAALVSMGIALGLRSSERTRPTQTAVEPPVPPRDRPPVLAPAASPPSPASSAPPASSPPPASSAPPASMPPRTAPKSRPRTKAATAPAPIPTNVPAPPVPEPVAKPVVPAAPAPEPAPKPAPPRASPGVWDPKAFFPRPSGSAAGGAR